MVTSSPSCSFVMSSRASCQVARGISSRCWVTLLTRFSFARLGLNSEGPGRGQHVVEPALVVEGLLRDVVELAVDELLEGLDGLLGGDVGAGQPGELLGNEERLRQEQLDLPGPGHQDLVVL